MTKGSWLGYIAAFLMWAAVLALGLWFMLIGREGLLGALSAFYVGDSLPRAWQVRFLDKVFWIVLGLLWMVLMVVGEEYLRRGVAERDLLKRFAKIVGPELLLIFAVDLFLFWLQGFGGLSWMRWLILGGELLIGVGLVLFVRSSRTLASG
jgi:hypothetical protein